MILEKQKEVDILSDGEESQESIGMTLDLDSAQFLMQMLSKTLYSDPIGSTIRETCSNALDSHRKAGEERPIIVGFKSADYSNYEFTVEDFGVGLDDDDVRDIISKYGKSTKRLSDNELGMFGLGFKSPLAYASSFHFIVRKDGTERKYMMYEGEDTNMIDLLYECPTEEANGTKIIVPVSWSDRYDFVKKIKEQLAYFENVYFDIYGGQIDNNFKIFRSIDFQYSEITSNPSMHLCLDNVYYPLDFVKMGINSISLPVALRFSLTDSIFPTVNRESIRYTPEAKKIIHAKIVEVANYFTEQYNSTITNTDNLKEVFKYYSDKRKDITLEGKIYDIKELLSYSKIPVSTPKLNGVELIDLKELAEDKDSLLKEYEVKFQFKRGRISEVNNWGGINVSSLDSTHFYLLRGVFGGNKRDYLRSILPNRSDTYFFIKKTNSYTLGAYKRDTSYSSYQLTYRKVLGLKKHPKNEWRQRIKEFQLIQSMVTSYFIDVDKITIPQSWLAARKKKRISIRVGRKEKLQGDIVGKQGTALERFVYGKNCKWVPDTFKLESVSKYKGLTIYDSHDNCDKLDPLYFICLGTQKVRFITFSARELRVLEKVEIHNLISYSKFMEGKNKVFKRLITAYIIKELIDSNRAVFEKFDCFYTLSNDFYSKLNKLDRYKRVNYQNTDSVIYEAIREVALENNLFDMEIYSTYLEVKEVLERLPFLQMVCRNFGSASEKDSPMVVVLRDLLKYHKFRLDYKNYELPVVDTSWMDELTTEEIVEEIVVDDEEEFLEEAPIEENLELPDLSELVKEELEKQEEILL